MHLIRHLSLVLLAIGLSGCFVSETPLIAEGDAVFPYQRIVYGEAGEKNVSTLVKQGDVYVLASKGEQAAFRFKDVGGGFYVVQVQSTTEKSSPILYAFIKVDLNAKTVQSYKAVAKDEDAGPGLTRCGDDKDQLCIGRLDAYVDFAKKAIAAGEEPDATYRLVSAE
jgi:hypothetical protein